MLTEKQVPLSVLVNVYEPEQSEPVVHNGEVLVMVRLLGGIPTRPKFYQIPGGIKKVSRSILACGAEEMAEGYRFSPVDVYSIEDAPVGDKFVVYENGERKFIDEKKNYVCDVVKDKDAFYVSSRFPFYQHLGGNPAFDFEIR